MLGEAEAAPPLEAALHDEHVWQRAPRLLQPRCEPPRREGAALLRQHAVKDPGSEGGGAAGKGRGGALWPGRTVELCWPLACFDLEESR
jgi:hypothetical protein